MDSFSQDNVRLTMFHNQLMPYGLWPKFFSLSAVFLIPFKSFLKLLKLITSKGDRINQGSQLLPLKAGQNSHALNIEASRANAKASQPLPIPLKYSVVSKVTMPSKCKIDHRIKTRNRCSICSVLCYGIVYPLKQARRNTHILNLLAMSTLVCSSQYMMVPLDPCRMAIFCMVAIPIPF